MKKQKIVTVEVGKLNWKHNNSAVSKKQLGLRSRVIKSKKFSQRKGDITM